MARFHDREPGITEDLLGRTTVDGRDPYAWCAEALADRSGTILDLACGSGPLGDPLDADGRPGPARRWIGVDTSTAELDVARRRGRGPVVRGSATSLPVPAASVASVACAMGLQVVEPLAEAWAELDRVLAADGRIVLLLPVGWPLTLGDAWTYLRLQVALGQVIRYPNGRALSRRRLARDARAHHLVVTSDEAARFVLPLPDAEAAALLVRSLYLPDTPSGRRRRGRRVVEGRIGGSIGIPLRRVVLDRRGARPRERAGAVA